MAETKDNTLIDKFKDIIEFRKNANPLQKVNEDGIITYNKAEEPIALKTDALRYFEHDLRPRTKVNVYVVTDLHLGAEEAQYQREIRKLERALNDPDGVVVLLGDIVNHANKASKSNPHLQKLSTVASRNLFKKLVTKVDAENKIVANVKGNHDGFRGEKEVGYDITETYAKNTELNAPAVSVHKFILNNAEDLNKTENLSIAVHHGSHAKGGPLGAVLAAIKLGKEIFGAQVTAVFMGHLHGNAIGYDYNFVPTPDNLSTEKVKVYGIEVAPGIPWEVYAAQMGFKPANINDSIYEFTQVKDKNKVKFELNAISLDMLDALETMPNQEQLRILKLFNATLKRERDKFAKRIDREGVSPAKAQQIFYNEFLPKLMSLREKVVQEYNLATNLEEQRQEKRQDLEKQLQQSRERSF